MRLKFKLLRALLLFLLFRAVAAALCDGSWLLGFNGEGIVGVCGKGSVDDAMAVRTETTASLADSFMLLCFRSSVFCGVTGNFE